MSDLTNVKRFVAQAQEDYTSALTSDIAPGAATVPIDDLTGYDDGATVVLVIDPGNSSKQAFTGVVDLTNSQLTDVAWTEGNDVVHSSGAIIVDYVTATNQNMLRAILDGSKNSIYNAMTLYGATGDGTTDDTTALQAALNATPAGAICYLPKGVYLISAPLIIPPGVTLQGTYANHTENVGSNWTDSATYIRPSGSFSGAAAIRMVDKEIGAYSKDSNGQRIFNINLDGTNTTGSVDGIKAEGKVHGVVMRDVCVRKFANHGIFCTYYTRLDTSVVNPYSWRMERVLVDTTTTNYGISLNNCTDSTLIDVEVINSGSAGWFLSGMGNSHLIACRAEWSTTDGFHIDAGGSYNAMMMTSCSTDSNTHHGVYVTGTGPMPVYINGMMNHRDGRNGGTGGGSYAGVFVDTCTAPVIIDSLSVTAGIDDDGTGTTHPDYGFRAATATYCSVNSGVLHGNVAGWYDEGTSTVLRRGPNIIQQTGTWNTPTTVTDNPMLNVASAATEDITKSKVSGDTNSRFGRDAKGFMSWGPGNAATDTTLYRSGVGVLKTDGTFNPDILNAGTGIKINGAATTGHVLRGNGTNFVDAALAVTDLSGLGTGVGTFLGTPSSANLASALTDETGSGAAVFGTGPTISLASASTAVTQSPADSSTKVATTAYADRNVYLPAVVSYKEDFLEGSSVSLTTSQTFNFDTNWHGIQISGGTQTVAVQAGTFANPGQLLFTTSATSGQGAVIWRSGPSAGVAPLGALGSNAGWEMHFVLSLSQTTLCAIRFGACIAGQHAADAPTAGIYYEYDTANTGNTDAKFTGVTRNASTSSYVTTNQINADTSIHHFRIRSTSAGTIGFTVDGGTEATLNTNVPTASVGPFIQVISRTTAAKSAMVDFTSYIANTART